MKTKINLNILQRKLQEIEDNKLKKIIGGKQIAGCSCICRCEPGSYVQSQHDHDGSSWSNISN